MPSETFGPWLRKQLRIRELSESDFARKLKRPPSMVNRWARGVRIPNPASCDLIADVLGIDVDVVLWQAGHRPVAPGLDADDPRIEIHGLVDRVNWTPANLRIIRGVLRSMVEED
jgi:transcriptional regulator with XRE-family HTH domain